MDLVAAGRHPLVGVDGERVDSLVNCKDERLVSVFWSELVMQQHQQNGTKYNNILARMAGQVRNKQVGEQL